ncbi:MAG TPA: isochorismatase family cysteine hydrolase [bacterium]|nr:isochorismatase family cysteine hydrolase [bacterium]HPN32228.1 isochorismatase family cysteine hydrolase [bacterium]
MPLNSALLIIDMQNDFVVNKNSPVYIPNSDKIILPLINARKLFLSNKQTVIHIITEHSQNRKFWGKKDIELNREYCMENTGGAEIIDELSKLTETELIVKKKFYSGFFETGLKEILEKKKIQNLFFTGLTTGCCVSSTARDAYNLGYNLFFIKECMTSSSEEAHNNELIFFQKSLGSVVSINLKTALEF